MKVESLLAGVLALRVWKVIIHLTITYKVFPLRQQNVFCPLDLKEKNVCSILANYLSPWASRTEPHREPLPLSFFPCSHLDY